MRGKLSEFMINTSPYIYCKYIAVNKKVENNIRFKVINAINEIMKAELLFYRKFVGDLDTIGFRLTYYDPCVRKNVVNGK